MDNPESTEEKTEEQKKWKNYAKFRKAQKGADEKMAESKVDSLVMGLITIIQMILHYLGIIGIIMGIIAILASNTPRGMELIAGGIGFLVIKYVFGFTYPGLKTVFKKKS